jgi:hypothetical protein
MKTLVMQVTIGTPLQNIWCPLLKDTAKNTVMTIL